MAEVPRASGLREAPRERTPPEFRLAGGLVQPQLNRVVRDGTTHQVEPKIMQVLVRLAERAGDVVTKDELISRVWEGVFVTEDVVVRAVRELRRIFEPGEQSPPVIETIRKRGYRLVAPVVYELPQDAERTGPVQGPRGRAHAGSIGARWRWAGAAVAAAIAVAGAYLARRPAPVLRPLFAPLTSLEGNEYDPAVAPDGTRVAFAWDGGRPGPTRIYVKLRGADAQIALTPGETGGSSEGSGDRAPGWSPDGTRIAFLRVAEGSCEIRLAPALGGPSRRLAPCSDRYARFSWSPDGRRLALAQRPDPASPWTRLRVLDVDSLETQDVATGAAGEWIDAHPAFSPDGRSLAFVRWLSENVGDLHVVPAAGGEPRRLTFDNADIMGYAWIEGGRRLALSSNRAGMYSLWAVGADGGEPVLLAGGGRKIKHPSASSAGDVIAYEGWNYEMNLCRLPLAGSPGAGAATLAPATDEWSFEPRYSPDGGRIAFVSTRSGAYELWVADRGGSGARRLTSFGGPFVGAPRWSPDGGRIVFVARPDGHADLFVVDAAGGPARRLTRNAGDHAAPSFSADGASVYFGFRAGGSWQVHALRLSDGSRRQVTRAGGFAGLESRDGRWLFYSRIDRRGLWRMPAGGGPEEVVTGELRPEDWAAWGVVDAGVYWLRPPEGESAPELALLRSGALRPEGLGSVPEMAWLGVELAPDASDLLYARLGRRDSNLVLMTLRP